MEILSRERYLRFLKKRAYLTVGAKNEACLPINEVTKDENAKLTDIFKVGDVVEGKIISVRNHDGYIVISRVEIEREEFI